MVTISRNVLEPVQAHPHRRLRDTETRSTAPLRLKSAKMKLMADNSRQTKGKLRRKRVSCLWVAFILVARAQGQEQVVIDSDYPGGNIRLERIDGDVVHVAQEMRDSQGWWFYWNFRVRGAGGRTLTFQFNGRSPVGVHGPAVSTDEGRNWSWLGANAVRGSTFSYAFPTGAAAVRFCFAIPYQAADLQSFILKHAGNSHLRIEDHAATRKGRRIERLLVGRLDGEPRYRVVLTARHHACESIASFTLEGILAAALADTDDGRWLRQHVEILAVPFMDMDGVEDGDQGKNRHPHDHNRDYLGSGIYPSVRALKEHVPGWSRGRLSLFLDLHCPYLRGGGDSPGSHERIYFVQTPNPKQAAELEQFSRILEEVQRGPLVYSSRHNLPWGRGFNTAEGGMERNSAGWFSRQPGIRWASTVEIPYANTGGAQPVTADGARAFGRDLAAAMRRYLESKE